MDSNQLSQDEVSDLHFTQNSKLPLLDKAIRLTPQSSFSPNLTSSSQKGKGQVMGRFI